MLTTTAEEFTEHPLGPKNLKKNILIVLFHRHITYTQMYIYLHAYNKPSHMKKPSPFLQHTHFLYYHAKDRRLVSHLSAASALSKILLFI